MADLYSSFSKFDDSIEKQSEQYSGLLGLTANKDSAVEVPNRNGYVYVRFRDNQSEVISVYNDQVSPVHNLPVLVTRRGSRWIIVGRDIERYENWGSYSAFLPKHGYQHEFPRDNPGGDITFSYIDQFMPLNVYPSGTPGSPNVLVAGYSYKKSDNTWAYVGETGTPSVLLYKPLDNQARMVLVYMDRDTGNPGILVNSGTSFAANLTGTADILPYLPPNTALQEPLKAIRLVSGTNYIEWNNLYDIRQIFNRDITGSGGGGGVPEAPEDGLVYGRKDAGWVEVSGTSGGGDAILTPKRIVITDVSGTQTTDAQFYYDSELNLLILGGNSIPVQAPNMLNIIGTTGSPLYMLWSYGAGFQGLAAFEKALGTKDSPTSVTHGTPMGRIAWRGYDGFDYSWGQTRAQIRAQALGDFVSGSNAGTEIVGSITPSGTVTIEDEFIKVNQAGVDILYGFYQISGSPLNYDNISAGDPNTNVSGAELETLTDGSDADSLHTHDKLDTGWIPAGTWTRTGNHTFTTTDTLEVGWKVRYKDGGAFEYGVVRAFSSGSPNTVTLITNSDYAMAAATITEAAYSLIENPVGFPHWFNYVATGSATPGTISSISLVDCKFEITGTTLHWIHRITYTLSGTATPQINFSLPAPVNLSGNSAFVATVDEVPYLGRGAIVVSGQAAYYSRSDFANLTNGSGKYVVGEGFYPL